MSRRDARERAFQLLFQLSVQKGDEDQQIGEFFANINEYNDSDREVIYSDADREYINRIAGSFRWHLDDLDASFVPFLKDWSRDRLPKVDLAILRLAAAEILYIPDIPLSVTINEAVVLARRYSGPESRAYINAVLGQLSKPEAGAGEAAWINTAYSEDAETGTADDQAVFTAGETAAAEDTAVLSAGETAAAEESGGQVEDPGGGEQTDG